MTSGLGSRGQLRPLGFAMALLKGQLLGIGQVGGKCLKLFSGFKKSGFH
jgi:hypothetical protein